MTGQPRCRGTGKVKHGSDLAAIIAAKKQQNSLLNVFWCEACRKWHLGRSNDPARNANRITEVLAAHSNKLSSKGSPA